MLWLMCYLKAAVVKLEILFLIVPLRRERQAEPDLTDVVYRQAIIKAKTTIHRRKSGEYGLIVLNTIKVSGGIKKQG